MVDQFREAIQARKEEWAPVRWVDVAEVMDISTKHLSQIVTGAVVGTWEMRELLAETLGLGIAVVPDETLAQTFDMGSIRGMIAGKTQDKKRPDRERANVSTGPIHNDLTEPGAS